MFAEIDDRREQVSKAHQDTFRWILEPGNVSQFYEWLQSDRGIFWVSGKPASGKSTLMKYIAQEGHLRSALQLWTGDTPLVIASFWFWAAGSLLQTTLVGLYRTLIFQMLKVNKHLCRTAFPDWQTKFHTTEPSMAMLTIAMNNILSTEALATNFFFVIDGLDEYDRDSVAKRELAELMVSMAQSPRVKLLLSSRPESPFEIAFRLYPSLCLEDLTRSDIVEYVQAKLWDNAFVRSVTEAERGDIDGIARFIIDHASGVFLWVTLVMDITLDGINDCETPLSIRRRITQLPLELDELFTHILNKRIPQHHRPEALRFLLAALTWESSKTQAPLYGVIMAMAEKASSQDLICSTAASNLTQISSVMSDFPGRIKSRCQGLLECTIQADDEIPPSQIATTDVQQNMIVKFLHRTLLDYLQQGEGPKALIETELGADFDIYPAIMAGIICFATSGGTLLHGNMKAHLKAFFQFNLLAEGATSRHTTELISILDESLRNKKLWAPKKPLTTFNGMTYDWSSALLENNSLISCDLLAYTIYTGGTLYLREHLARDRTTAPERLSTLLHYAVPPITTGGDESESKLRINYGATAILLEYGADPLFCFRGISAWQNALRAWLAKLSSSRQDSDVSEADSAMFPQVLELFLQVARQKNQWEDLHRIVMDYSIRDDAATSLVLRQHILEKECCSGTPLVECICSSGQSLREIVLDVLTALEAPTSASAVPGADRQRDKTGFADTLPPRVLPLRSATAALSGDPTLGDLTPANVGVENAISAPRSSNRRLLRKLGLRRIFARP